MKGSVLAELVRIVRAITILSPTSFSFAKRITTLSEPTTWRGSAPFPSKNPLLAALQQQLYEQSFCHKFRGHLSSPSTLTHGDEDFVQALSAANTSQERWEADWRIASVEPAGFIVAERYGVTRALWPGEFVTHNGPGMAPTPGTLISIFFARESKTMQPGFHFAFGETAMESDDDYVRFYWNVESAGATRLMRGLTEALNRFQVPFRFKCLSDSALYDRLDAAVLYVNKRFYRVTAELVVDVHQKVRKYLGQDSPLFTKQLASGLGFCEDPGNGESFGLHRCRLVAEGIWNAYRKGLKSQKQRVACVVKLFSRSGISLEHPYLNPGSSDYYAFPRYQHRAS